MSLINITFRSNRTFSFSQNHTTYSVDFLVTAWLVIVDSFASLMQIPYSTFTEVPPWPTMSYFHHGILQVQDSHSDSCIYGTLTPSFVEFSNLLTFGV